MQRLIQGDALSELRTLPGNSIQTCVTSPPYYGLRDYGTGRWLGGNPTCVHQIARTNGRVNDPSEPSTNSAVHAETWQSCGHCGAKRLDRQIGLEDTPAIYVDKLVEIFGEVRRVLRDDGTLWLNLGDSYAGSGKGGQSEEKRSDNWQPEYGNKGKRYGFKPKDLIGIPWRVALALQEAGWYLRQDIIWHKPNPMPESAADRCTKAHEYIFLLSKSARYYYDADAIREPYAESQREAGMARARNYGYNAKESYQDWYDNHRERATWHPAGDDTLVHGRATKIPGSEVPNLLHPLGRNKRSVWAVTPKPFHGAHFATFPPDLIKPCILAGAPPNGVVLDPFMGSGTTGAVAKAFGRSFVGIELNPEYLTLAETRILAVPTII